MPDRIRVSNNYHLAGVPFRLLSELDFVDYRVGTPLENARRLHEGQVDLALIPLYDYFSHGGYLAFEFGMGCRQRSGSMILYAEQEIADLDTIHLYASSRTSRALLQILLAEYWRNTPRFIRQRRHAIIDCVRRGQGVLALHDFPGQLVRQLPVQVDLATAWYEHTGLPSAYLIWAVRPGVLSDSQITRITETFYRGSKISAQLARFFAGEFGVTPEQAAEFVGENRRFYFDEFLRHGVTEFERRARKYRLIPDGALRWLQKPLYPMSALTRLQPAPAIATPSAATHGNSRSASEIFSSIERGLPLSITDAVTVAHNLHHPPVYQGVRSLLRNGHVIRRDRQIPLPAAELLRAVELSQLSSNSANLSDSSNTCHATLDSIADIAAVERVLARRRCSTNSPRIAISLTELLKIARDEECSAHELAVRLITAGVSATEDLQGDLLLSDKLEAEQRWYSPEDWLELAALFHTFAVPSLVSLRASARDSWEERVLHLERLRSLNDETGGIKSFAVTVPLDQPEFDSKELAHVTSIARLFLHPISYADFTHNPATASCVRPAVFSERSLHDG